MTQTPELYRIALTMIQGVGDILARKLLDACGDPEAIFQEKKRILSLIPGISNQLATQICDPNVLRRAEYELEFVHSKSIKTIFITDEEYPYRLKECPDAPLLLYSKGSIDLNRTFVLSIVGTRKATMYGKELTEDVIKEIAGILPDMLIVSGLAYGIDIYAHRYALKYGLPTVGVLAHGLDRIYPHVHRETALKMLDNGGLLTDYPSGTNPDRQNFVMRNRIVAGLADATLVIESADRGGSLITADIAFSYGRDVFAFPGKVKDIQSQGCNKLIRQNKAGLITSATDLVAAMCWDVSCKMKEPEQQSLSFDVDMDEKNQQILEHLRKTECLHINQLANLIELPVHELSSRLLELEMDGYISVLPGNIYRVNG